MKELTKAEEQVMLILWSKKEAFVREIINEMDEPKPAYTTISTIVRILESKGYVAHEEFGKTHKYFPLVSKEEYTGSFMKGFISNYFSGSYKNLMSFFTKSKDLSVQELEEIKKMIDKEIDKKQGE